MTDEELARDREQFCRDNALSLIEQRDTKIKRLQREYTKALQAKNNLRKVVRALKAEMARLQALPRCPFCTPQPPPTCVTIRHDCIPMLPGETREQAESRYCRELQAKETTTP